MNFLLTNQETKRLLFRPLLASDFDDWMPIFARKEVAKFLEMDPKLSQRECCQQWFDKSLFRQKNNLGEMNVLMDKKMNRMVGQCGLLIQTIENAERLEIGYSILPEFWKMGYATEAAVKCKNYAFENNFAESLISMVHLENKGSEKVALNNSMTLEKQIGSFNIFSISKETWKEKS
jgi:ribosomal-protein-alanine N-acetyltransferase